MNTLSKTAFLVLAVAQHACIAQESVDLQRFVIGAAKPHTGIVYCGDLDTGERVLRNKAALIELSSAFSSDAVTSGIELSSLGATDRQRVEQLVLMVDGLFALTRPWWQTKLQLSEGTVKKVHQIETQFRRELVGPNFSTYFGSDGSLNSKLKYLLNSTKINIDFGLEVLSVLSEEERTRLSAAVSSLESESLYDTFMETFDFSDGSTERPPEVAGDGPTNLPKE